MSKTQKSVLVTVRMSPSEKESAVNLADQLGLNISDVVRLSVIETIKKGSISIQGLTENNTRTNNGRSND